MFWRLQLSMVMDYWESKLVAGRGHLKYLNELRSLSRKNRLEATETEKILWNKVLKGRKTGYKFLRQKPIYRFILDFYCRELLLAIEIDGAYHKNRKWINEFRDNFLKNMNIETLRINSEMVINSFDEVEKTIYDFIRKRKVSLFKGKAPEGGKGFKY